MVVTTERVNRSMGDVDSTPAMLRVRGATPFQTTIRRPSKAAASAVRRAVSMAPDAAAGAATPSTSAVASSSARRDLVGTGSPFSLMVV